MAELLTDPLSATLIYKLACLLVGGSFALMGYRLFRAGLFGESARLVADVAFDTIGAARIEGRSAAATAPCASWAPNPKGCYAAVSNAPAASCVTTSCGRCSTTTGDACDPH